MNMEEEPKKRNRKSRKVQVDRLIIPADQRLEEEDLPSCASSLAGECHIFL